MMKYVRCPEWYEEMMVWCLQLSLVCEHVHQELFTVDHHALFIAHAKSKSNFLVALSSTVEKAARTNLV